ncbi:flagellar biosynthesis protein FliQ [bacterium]|nr:flagellar biosynthesis protein FliQ [bacterium]
MDAQTVIDIGRDAIWVLIKLSLPLMLVALVVGLVIGLLQALTQIQEMTLTFVPKILAIFLTMMALMPYFISQMTDFNTRMAERMTDLE